MMSYIKLIFILKIISQCNFCLLGGDDNEMIESVLKESHALEQITLTIESLHKSLNIYSTNFAYKCKCICKVINIRS